MNPQKIFYFIIMFLATVSPAAGQEKILNFSLEEAIQFALINNTNAKNSRLDADINRKRALEILTEGLPQLSLDVRYRHNLKLPVSIVPANTFPMQSEEFAVEFGTKHNVTADFLVTQLIVDGRYFIGLKANKTLVAMGDEIIGLSESEVRLNVSTAYYAVLVARESRMFVQKNLESLNKLLYETTELYNSGFAEELDVDRLQLQLSNMKSNDRKTELQLELTKNILKYQMGLDHTIDISLSDNLESLLAATTVDADAAFSYESRKEFRLLSLQGNMRAFDAQRIKAAYMPSLSAFAGYGFNAQRQEFNIFDFNEKWFQIAYWGIELRVPIFDSYRNGAIYQQKRLEQQKIMNQISDFKQQSNLQVTQTKTGYKNSLDEFQNQRKNLDLAQKIYDKVQIMYKEGVGTSLELANAETSLTQTQANYVNAIYDLLMKRSELENALGKY